MKRNTRLNSRPLLLALAIALSSACSEEDLTAIEDGSIDDASPEGTSLDETSPEGAFIDETSLSPWASCADNTALECATLTVPMDYSGVQSGEIDIALNRRPAIDQPATGTLLFIEGGPGGSGMDLLDGLTDDETVPDAVRRQYDLVGFDQRGVGGSTPVDCEEFAIEDVNADVSDDAEIQELVQANELFSRQCSDKYGDYLQYLGSRSVVRDMESIRLALGADKLNGIGYSYGTRLAGLYLQDYPETSGAFVLDGSVRSESDFGSLVKTSLPAKQAGLEAALGQCTATFPDCDPDFLMQALGDRLDTLRATENNAELEVVIPLLIVASLGREVGESLSPLLSSYILTDDITGLEVVAGELENVVEDGVNETVNNAVTCADDPYRPTVPELSSTLVEYNALADVFAEFSLPHECAGWPEAIEPLAPIVTGTAPASLVIGGNNDAQTPIGWAEEMAAAIGGHFLASAHDGHTAVFGGKSECVDRLTTDFLLGDQLPNGEDCLVPVDALQ